ncbi:uncharacterized protein LOC119461949 [Dermacentor silvarum]|uniref:uncharacterized protein LOC119461949 n=1 Tax=Dermacentor silvarum TaxID=543639 RepID=UPI001896DE57|nr:uncharacterized protein LOC119461949 [Dermacentor silvarum]
MEKYLVDSEEDLGLKEGVGSGGSVRDLGIREDMTMFGGTGSGPWQQGGYGGQDSWAAKGGNGNGKFGSGGAGPGKVPVVEETAAVGRPTREALAYGSEMSVRRAEAASARRLEEDERIITCRPKVALAGMDRQGGKTVVVQVVAGMAGAFQKGRGGFGGGQRGGA